MKENDNWVFTKEELNGVLAFIFGCFLGVPFLVLLGWSGWFRVVESFSRWVFGC